MITRDEARRLWIAALRSGNYKQGIRNLKKMTSRGEIEYCCLGVACELFASELGIVGHDTYSSTLGYTITSYDGSICLLPLQISELLGLVNIDGGHAIYGSRNSLTVLNDGKWLDFEQIADELETGNYWVENVK